MFVSRMLCVATHVVLLVLALAIGNATADLGSSAAAPAGSCASQEDALLSFRDGLENAGKEVLRSWNRNSGVSTWRGVTVGARGQIVKLELPSLDLRGRLTPLWDLLPSIQVMNLSHNSLSGSLSSTSCGGQSRSIQTLDLSFNRFSGQLREEIRHLQGLKQLYLRSNTLSGGLPRGLFELRSLEVLDLSLNNFTGSISADFGLLHRLRRFNLSRNGFSGTFPAANFSRIAALTSIDLSFNALRSIQPVEIGISSSLPAPESPFFKQLQILDLSSNIFSGPIPDFTFKISALKLLNLSGNAFSGPLIVDKAAASIEYINLAGNNLSGPIPPRLGLFLTNLTTLDLCSNAFTGDIPDTIANLQKLQQLKVSNNQLSHMPDVGISLPDSLKVLSASNNLFSGPLSVSRSASLLPSKLEVLYLPGNYFSGPIPAELGQLKNLKKLILNQNDFHDEIPASLASCELLEEIWINNNRLTGQIPTEIFSMKHLRMLVLANNSLSGSPVPQGIARCKTLEVLWLEQNEFSGPISAEVGQLSSLLMLSLASNNLTGKIPASIGKLNKLVGLDLGSNSISGAIPDELAGLSSIQFLFLSSNLMEQQIPEWIGNLPKLRAVDFSFNRFTGRIPSTWKNSTLTSLSPKYSDKPPSALVYNNEGQKYIGYALPTTLDFSHNELTGSIPEQLGVLRNLQILNLGHNKLEGTIPASLGDVPALLKLDLSSNNLTGSIPPDLSKLTFLSDLNVSFNHLEGEIPQSGQFYTFSNLSFVGNPKLCGLPLQKCSPKLGAADESKKIATISMAQKLIPLYIVIAGSVGFCAFWAAFIILIRRRHKLLSQDEEEEGDDVYSKKKQINSSEVSTMSEGVAWISPKELMSATGNYTQANIIGDGGFGIVYKATLADGSLVAVKKLITEGGFGTQGEREFLAEMQTLGKIKHKNLVCLKGYSSDGKDRILVYKYLKNGSLDTWLHCRDDGTKPLDWETRFRIILGAARGIAFLHHECFPPIVHRDIKASNILLDEDFEAHMADFGLARLMQDAGDTHVSTDIAGTVGYIPPEYNSSCMATMRGDVYSFGVVVLETIIGKRPTDAAFRRAGGIGQLVAGNCSNQELQSVIDPALVVSDCGDVEAGSASSPAAEIVEVMRIACLCCVEKPARRPEMKHVVRMLEAVEARSSVSVAAAAAGPAASLVSPPSVEGGSKHFLNNVEI